MQTYMSKGFHGGLIRFTVRDGIFDKLLNFLPRILSCLVA
jgi:hypothetical protein